MSEGGEGRNDERHGELERAGGDSGEPVARDAGDPGTADVGAGGSVVSLAAALRRDAADLQVYAEVLSVSLADALPPGSVALERKRSMSDRVAGREGRVQRAEVTLEDDQRLILTVAHGRPSAEVAKVVRGVVLSRTPVSIEEWTLRLAEAVTRRARSDERAKAALERLVLGG